jgi:hypothetical protein
LISWIDGLGTFSGTSRRCTTVCCCLSLIKAGRACEERWEFPQPTAPYHDFGMCTVVGWSWRAVLNFFVYDSGCSHRCSNWLGAILTGSNDLIAVHGFQVQ